MATHPGVVFKEEFVVPYKIVTDQICEFLDINPYKMDSFLLGESMLTSVEFLSLSEFTQTDLTYWISMKDEWENIKQY